MERTCSPGSPFLGSEMPVYIDDLVQNTLLIYSLDIAMVDAFSQRYQTVSACVSLLIWFCDSLVLTLQSLTMISFIPYLLSQML